MNAAKKSKSVNTSNEKFSVLVVDDSEMNRDLLLRRLGKMDLELSEAGNGEEALKYLNDDTNEKPDLILLDLNIPIMNGIEFLRTIRGDSVLRSIPIVMLTTSDDERDIAECYDLNVAGYMIKPLDLELFQEIIRTVVIYWSCSELPKGQDKSKWFKKLAPVG